MLAKQVTTLDVLSGGRAWLGIGAGWNEEECIGLGIPFPSTARAVRAARGDAADLPADVERGRGPVRRQALPARPDAELTAVGAAPAPADPDRRQRRAEDAADGGAVRPGLQPVRQPRDRAQARRAARALRGPRPGLRRDREDRHRPARARAGRRAGRRDPRAPARPGRARHHPRAHQPQGHLGPAACSRSTATGSSPRPPSSRPGVSERGCASGPRRSDPPHAYDAVRTTVRIWSPSF